MSLARILRRVLVAPRRAVRPADGCPGPIVKWAGGKTRLLPELLGRLPAGYNRYHEPFLGGGALFFRLGPEAARLSDTNADLINAYRAVQASADRVLGVLARHRTRHSETHYYATREAWNSGEIAGAVERAAAFIYLNKTCYNGLYRVNSRGEFNVPMGRYTHPAIADEAGLHAAQRALRGAELVVAPFEHVLDDAAAGDLVYFDPPYDPLSATASFTSYTAGGFGPADQDRLAAVFRALDARGCAVVLSNHDTPLVRRLYAGYRIDRVLCARAINSRADSRGAVAEVIVRNEV
jgi:DNA adenine methylase